LSQLLISPSVWLCFKSYFTHRIRYKLYSGSSSAGSTSSPVSPGSVCSTFFNLVNVPVQKGLDADTKKKVNPDLLGRALWYFRWGAVVNGPRGLGLLRDVHP
jgi:hypothetical protein